MSAKWTVTMVNGSPHEGISNTGFLMGLVAENLARRDFSVEEIYLNQQHIEYCTGCAWCLEHGACWIKDDHRGILKKVLEADALILGSPVYFFQVTAQMKTFMDRSLALGHRPRAVWKPGLAVSVSAGHGETQVARYLSHVMRAFGAFSVGELTAMAVGPGGFVGLDAVKYRAERLADDLAQAVEQGVRYPATELDLSFWYFMAGLVHEHRDFMTADHNYWEEQGLYESFRAYVGQHAEPSLGSPEQREQWIKGLQARFREQGTLRAGKGKGEAASGEEADEAREVQSLRELLAAMPQALNPEAAQGVHVVYQFEVSGPQGFTAHLAVADGKAAFAEGPAADPSVVIWTPPAVWLAVSTGELDGAQAFMAGKFKVQGDLSLLMQLKALFTPPPA